MDGAELVVRVIELLVERGLVEVGPGDITADSDLRGDLGLDSLKMVELIVALEEEFGVSFDDSSLNRDDFTTVGVVARLVAGLMS